MFSDELIKSKQGENVVLLFTSCKVQDYQGIPCLNTTASTQIFIDPPISHTNILKQRMVRPIVFTEPPRKEEKVFATIPTIYNYLAIGVPAVLLISGFLCFHFS